MQVLEEGYVGDGVSCSSAEASNDRGAKDWQIVIAKERNLWSYTAKTANYKGKRNLIA